MSLYLSLVESQCHYDVKFGSAARLRTAATNGGKEVEHMANEVQEDITCSQVWSSVVTVHPDYRSGFQPGVFI